MQYNFSNFSSFLGFPVSFNLKAFKPLLCNFLQKKINIQFLLSVFYNIQGDLKK